MILTIHAKPNAKTTRCIKAIGERTFAIALHASAVENKANEELIRYLAEVLEIPKSLITIVRGATSKIKQVEVPDGTDLTPLSQA